VFSELIANIGVKGVQVEELFDLEAASFDKLKPIYGLVFLFKWQKEEDKRPAIKDEIDGLFFAKQVVSNACATQALLSILLNRPEIELGSTLEDFKSFALALSPEMRGEVLGQSTVIREVHNSFARPEPFVFGKDESKHATEDDDVYHFIGYVPVNGALYELDGLKPGPIRLDDNCDINNWLDKARPAIQERISRYSQKEIRFNLLALVKNRKDVLSAKLKTVSESVAQARQRLASSGSSMDDDGGGTMDESGDLATTIANGESEIKALKDDIESEEDKYKKWKIENVRRKHNYIPFAFNLLKVLAQKGKLQELLKKGNEAVAARETRKKAEKEKEKEKEKSKDSKSAPADKNKETATVNIGKK